MRWFLNSTKWASVKTLIKLITPIILPMLMAIFLFSAEAGATTAEECRKLGMDFSKSDERCLEKPVSPYANDCKELKQQLSDANRRITDACRKASLGDVNKCLNASLECGKAMGDTTYTSTSQILATLPGFDPTLSAAAGALGASNTNNQCPQASGRDYFSQKDQITKEIEQTKQDLADLNDEKAKVQDDFNQTMQKLQEELTKANDDLNKTKLDINDKKRKQLSEFQAQQQQMKDQLRQKSTHALEQRSRLIQSQQDQALQLIAMTDASGNRACMKAVADAKKSYESLSTNQSSNYIAQATQRKQDLINTYNDCMDSFMQKRNALNKLKKEEQDQINKAITDDQQAIDEMTNSLNTASAQLTQMQTDADTELNNATQKIMTMMQTNQQKMMAAQQKMNTNLQTISVKNMNLTQKLNRLNNELMTLGPAPKSRSSDYSPEEAASDISSGVDEVLSITKDENNKDCLGKSGSGNKTIYESYQKGIR